LDVTRKRHGRDRPIPRRIKIARIYAALLQFWQTRYRARRDKSSSEAETHREKRRLAVVRNDDDDDEDDDDDGDAGFAEKSIRRQSARFATHSGDSKRLGTRAKCDILLFVRATR
jgi:hypothetical protein